MTTATVSSKGWIVIPVELRKNITFTKAHAWSWWIMEGFWQSCLRCPTLSNKHAGMVKGGKSLLAALKGERRRERERER